MFRFKDLAKMDGNMILLLELGTKHEGGEKGVLVGKKYFHVGKSR